MAKKSIWDVEALMGQTIILTLKGGVMIVGTVVEQDKDTITIVMVTNRPVIVSKVDITSLTQKAPGEA